VNDAEVTERNTATEGETMTTRTAIPDDRAGYEFTTSLTATAAAIGLLRDLTRVHLRAWGLDGLVDDARLVVSELGTNALAAAPGGMIEFRLSTAPGMLLVELWDPCPSAPVRRNAREEDTGGRGLEIVEFLAEAWGTRFPAKGGKTVWARMPRA
jgi:anti-sigma regulatory factor (Ser/Thr protein kinase)